MQVGSKFQKFLQLAKKFHMLIISSILERHGEAFFNTCVVISTTGEVVGTYRKGHIPPIEKAFLSQGEFDHPVFATEFGMIGILICYERHFPLNWMMLGLKEAQIVFNPSSEDANSLSDRLWLTEAASAAAANGIFAVAVNRVGSENFANDVSFDYFGSNYVASPDGFRTPSLARNCDGLLIAELNLKSCQHAKEQFSFHKNQHLEIYVRKLHEVVRQ